MRFILVHGLSHVNETCNASYDCRYPTEAKEKWYIVSWLHRETPTLWRALEVDVASMANGGEPHHGQLVVYPCGLVTGMVCRVPTRGQPDRSWPFEFMYRRVFVARTCFCTARPASPCDPGSKIAPDVDPLPSIVMVERY